MPLRTPSRPAFSIVFWGAAVVAFGVAIMPHPPEMPGAPNDKVQHILAFLLLTTLAVLAYPRASLVRIVVALSLFGALIEIVQAVPALNRDSDVLDWVADTAAAAVVAIVAWLWHRRRARR